MLQRQRQGYLQQYRAAGKDRQLLGREALLGSSAANAISRRGRELRDLQGAAYARRAAALRERAADERARPMFSAGCVGGMALPLASPVTMN